MLKKILSISGKPGLYKLLSQGKNMLIVESLIDGKRMPSYNQDRVVSLGEIAIYTDEGEKPLREVLALMKEKYSGAPVDMDVKKADDEALKTLMADILPSYDRDRVRVSDMRKLVAWYNLLVKTGNDDFTEEEAKKPEEDTKK
ncbi:MAG: DUF5606 domain-containing protein [Bacteroidales bacterium]|nr:DUF5606 domain-containing protein [Bacteroidales bacterium]